MIKLFQTLTWGDIKDYLIHEPEANRRHILNQVHHGKHRLQKIIEANIKHHDMLKIV